MISVVEIIFQEQQIEKEMETKRQSDKFQRKIQELNETISNLNTVSKSDETVFAYVLLESLTISLSMGIWIVYNMKSREGFI